MNKRLCRYGIRILLGLSSVCGGQTATYKDVVVLINQNSELSQRIGEYFVAKRKIPPTNIITVSTATTEEIDSTTFEHLRQQVESALIGRGIQDSINYIVTTKGMPLKVRRTVESANASVESELMLILGPYAMYIGKPGRTISPYYRKTTDFTRKQYGIYLVTRLDGYTEEDVYSLIDRASIIHSSVPVDGTFVFDQDPTWNTSVPYLNTNMKNAAVKLQERNYSVVLDTTTVFLTEQQNVIGYVSWGSNDRNAALTTRNAIPHNTWIPGAIAETYVSTSGRSFLYPPVYGQSLIADLIAEGATAVKGYVYEPYANAMTDVSVAFPMYADGYTVAECFFAGSPSLSWMDVVIGDPKFRLVGTRLPDDYVPEVENEYSPLPVTLTSLTASVDNGKVLLQWETATEVQCYGYIVERRSENSSEWKQIQTVQGNGTSNINHIYSVIDIPSCKGVYIYRLRQIDIDGTEHILQDVAVEYFSHFQTAIVTNYPNPFNPRTTIHCILPKTQNATIRVYNLLGQVVSTIYQGEVHNTAQLEFPFSGENLASGVYWLVVEYDKERILHRMMVLK